jgi:hypothetical protein
MKGQWLVSSLVLMIVPASLHADIVDKLRWPISLSDHLAVVGLPGATDNGADSGAANMERLAGTTWPSEAWLLAPDGAASDYFGCSVHTDGTVVIVGAVGNDDQGSESGSAYIWRHGATTWSFEQKLLAADGQANDLFGSAVVVAGDVAVVGAVGDDDNGAESGSAYVFRFNGVAWVQEQKLLADDGGIGDEFGFSLGITDNTIFVAAPYDDDKGADAGAVYVFHFDGAQWTQVQKLKAGDGAAGDEFGYSLGTSGNWAVIGAPGDDDDGGDSGSAYAFHLDGGTWKQDQKLTAQDGDAGDEYGTSVDVSGNSMMVGAPGDDTAANDAGIVYLYMWCNSRWRQRGWATPPGAAAGDRFGISIAVSGDMALQCSEFMQGQPNDDGTFYWWDLSQMDCGENGGGCGAGAPASYMAVCWSVCFTWLVAAKVWRRRPRWTH